MDNNETEEAYDYAVNYNLNGETHLADQLVAMRRQAALEMRSLIIRVQHPNGHFPISVHADSNPADLVKICKLRKQVIELTVYEAMRDRDEQETDTLANAAERYLSASVTNSVDSSLSEKDANQNVEAAPSGVVEALRTAIEGDIVLFRQFHESNQTSPFIKVASNARANALEDKLRALSAAPKEGEQPASFTDHDLLQMANAWAEGTPYPTPDRTSFVAGMKTMLKAKPNPEPLVAALQKKPDLALLEKIWVTRNPVHEFNASSGEDMFWGTVACVFEDYAAATTPPEAITNHDNVLKAANDALIKLRQVYTYGIGPKSPAVAQIAETLNKCLHPEDSGEFGVEGNTIKGI